MSSASNSTVQAVWKNMTWDYCRNELGKASYSASIPWLTSSYLEIFAKIREVGERPLCCHTGELFDQNPTVMCRW